jgi:hypothetical protein
MGNDMVKKKKGKQRAREDQEFLIELNKVSVSTEGMTRVAEEVAKDPGKNNLNNHGLGETV